MARVTTVTVDVDVDLADIDDDDIAEEAESRGLCGGMSKDEFMTTLRALFQSGRASEVEALARQQVNDLFGTCY